MSWVSDLVGGATAGTLSGLFGGLGQLAKDIRTAVTGQEPIDATKAAELALKVAELESAIERARLSVMLAEAASQDKWTSRGRPMFLYVMYVFLLMGIPMGILSIFKPDTATAIAAGCNAWLAAIPEEMWWLFGAGYLGYSTVRTVDKSKGARK